MKLITKNNIVALSSYFIYVLFCNAIYFFVRLFNQQLLSYPYYLSIKGSQCLFIGPEAKSGPIYLLSFLLRILPLAFLLYRYFVVKKRTASPFLILLLSFYVFEAYTIPSFLMWLNKVYDEWTLYAIGGVGNLFSFSKLFLGNYFIAPLLILFTGCYLLYLYKVSWQTVVCYYLSILLFALFVEILIHISN